MIIDMQTKDEPVFWARAIKDLLSSSGLAEEIKKQKETLSSAEIVYFSSDYGGEDQRASYRTYVFLVVDFRSLTPWFEKIRAIYDNRFGSVPRTMDFKGMHDKIKQRALPDWLEAAEVLKGCLFTLSVQSSIKTIFGQPGDVREITRRLAEAGLGQWTDATAEKVLRILHFKGLISSLLLRDGHKLFWVTDRDSICANQEKLGDLSRAWPRVLYLYIPSGLKIPKHHIQPPGLSKKPDERIFDETLTYADLAAGALQEFFAHNISQNGSWKDRQAKAKTVEILRWLAKKGPTLKRFHIRLDAVQERDGIRLVPSVVRLDPASNSLWSRLNRRTALLFWSLVERITRTAPQAA